MSTKSFHGLSPAAQIPLVALFLLMVVVVMTDTQTSKPGSADFHNDTA